MNSNLSFGNNFVGYPELSYTENLILHFGPSKFLELTIMNLKLKVWLLKTLVLLVQVSFLFITCFGLKIVLGDSSGGLSSGQNSEKYSSDFCHLCCIMALNVITV